MGAFKRPFKGKTDQLLIKAISEMNVKRKLLADANPDDREDRFKNFTSIIQSSGMGKSRVVDEVSKSVFTIPTVLRDTGPQGGKLSCILLTAF